MKNKIASLGVSGILLTLLVSSCNRNSENQNTQNYFIPVSLTVKAYGFFQPGTYWIYQDSASHALDSEYVVSASQGSTSISQNQNMGYTGTFGWLKEQWMGSRQGQVNNLYVDMTQSMNGPCVLWMDEHIAGVYKGQNILMSDNWVPGYVIYPSTEPNGYLEFMRSLDTVKVLSKAYPAVIQYYERQNSVFQYNRTNIYLAKNVGIIRKELLDSVKVWNLIRSHIVQ